MQIVDGISEIPPIRHSWAEVIGDLLKQRCLRGQHVYGSDHSPPHRMSPTDRFDILVFNFTPNTLTHSSASGFLKCNWLTQALDQWTIYSNVFIQNVYQYNKLSAQFKMSKRIWPFWCPPPPPPPPPPHTGEELLQYHKRHFGSSQTDPSAWCPIRTPWLQHTLCTVSS